MNNDHFKTVKLDYTVLNSNCLLSVYYDGTCCSSVVIIGLPVDNVTLNLQIQPQTMLFGHTGAVTCLAMANNTIDNTFIVSSADNGYIQSYTSICL